MGLSPYIYVNLTSAVCCVGFTLFLFIAYFSKKNMDNLENVIYRRMLIANFSCTIIYTCFYTIDIITYNSNHQDILYLIVYIFSKIAPFTVMVWATFLLVYLIIVINEQNEKFINNVTNNLHKYLRYLYIWFVIIGIISSLEKSVVVLETAVEKELLLIMNAYLYVVILSCIILIIRYGKKLSKKKILPIYLIIPIFVVAAIFGFLGVRVVFVYIVGTLINHLMYHTIENPDLKLINQLEYAKNQAEKSNKAKTDFLSSMSHEIRTPLNAIVGLSQMIKESDDINRIHEDSNDIIVASQNLQEIVDGILDINKLEANEMEINEVNYNPKQEFDNLVKLMKIRIGEKPLELRTIFPDTLPKTLYGDKEKLKQIITNLLTNAIKYTEKGFVDFNVSCQNIKDKCELTITVKDTGRGMKEEQMAKLFTKFNRLEEDKDSNIEGTGLGLAITKSLVELFDGKITAESIYGQGSKFTIILKQTIVEKGSLSEESVEEPVKEEIKTEDFPATELPNDTKQNNEEIHLSTESVPNIDNTNNLSNQSFKNEDVIQTSVSHENNTSPIVGNKADVLLVVDDNNINLKVASKMLKEFSFNVDQAHSGFECLQKLQDNPNKYDIIFMDIMMPGMDGVETMQKIKSLSNFNTPVIALTADSMEGSREKYLAAGFDEYVSKPIIKKILESTLNKYVDLENIKIIDKKENEEEEIL